MASLSDCPNEIHLGILRNLVPTTFNKTPASLHSMCLVSKRFFSLAQPFLYSKIHLKWEGEDAENPRIPLLLRSLLKRRGLGNYVKHLCLEGDDTHTFFAQGDWVPMVSMAAVDMEEVLKFIDSTHMAPGDSRMWKSSVTQPFLDGVVAVLLALLPDLKSLSMGPDFAAEMGVTNCVLQRALGPERTKNPNQLPRFGQLRSVNFDNERTEFCQHGYWECSVLPFFYLPEIEHLSLAIHIGCFWESPPNPSKLTSLQLHRLAPDQLAELLCITTGLKKLSWTCCCYPTDDLLMDGAIEPTDLDILGNALTQASGTLEELVLHIDDGDIHELFPPGANPFDISFLGSLEALSSLEHLKKLQVPWVWLVGWSPDEERSLGDYVPESVESLVLTLDLDFQAAWAWGESSIFERMANFLEAQKGSTNLRFVSLVTLGAFVEWESGEDMELDMIAAEAGISFLMDPYGIDF